jgi:hypothetical protein
MLAERLGGQALAVGSPGCISPRRCRTPVGGSTYWSLERSEEIDLPRRNPIADTNEARAMTPEELATLLDLVPVPWQTFFHLLAATGCG